MENPGGPAARRPDPEGAFGRYDAPTRDEGNATYGFFMNLINLTVVIMSLRFRQAFFS
jgi:hypothetical protein